MENSWLLSPDNPMVFDFKLELVGDKGQIQADPSHNGAVRRMTGKGLKYSDLLGVAPTGEGRDRRLRPRIDSAISSTRSPTTLRSWPTRATGSPTPARSPRSNSLPPRDSRSRSERRNSRNVRMASLSFDRIGKTFADGTVAVSNLSIDLQDGGIGRPGWPVRLRQDYAPAPGGRAGAPDRRSAAHRRRRCDRHRTGRPRRRHGLPELWALSAHDRVSEHGVRSPAAAHARRRDRASSAKRRTRST